MNFASKVKAFVVSFPTQNGESSPPSYEKEILALLNKMGIDAQTIQFGESGKPLLTLLNGQCGNSEAIIIAQSSSKFYNLYACTQLINNFFKYHADIGFADNYPKGMVFEIIRKEALAVLENVRTQNNISQDESLIDALVAIDVNAFTLENLYAEKDISRFRISLIENTLQNSFTANRLAAAMQEQNPQPLNEWNFCDMADLIEKKQHLLKTLPSFYEWHICPEVQEKIYSPLYKKLPPLPIANIAPMPLANFEKMLTKVQQFCTQGTMQLSAALGDPASHRYWQKFASLIVNAGFKCFIETDGVAISNEDIKFLLQQKNGKNITFILQLHCINSSLYKTLHGMPMPEGLIAKAELLLLQHPNNVYVEIVKTNDTIEHIEKFYNHFKRFSKNIIINKYNTYRGRLPERRDRIMEPLEKMPCWHLRNDVVIDASGDVWLCKQDIEKKHILGNLLHDNFEKIFASGEEAYKKHLTKFSFCNDCDEYYTFNF